MEDGRKHWKIWWNLHRDKAIRSPPKAGPLRFGSENQSLLNFAHEYILVLK